MPTVRSPRDPSAPSATVETAPAQAPAVDLTNDERPETFLAALRPHGAKALVFEYGDGTALGLRRVQPGYHVTEIRDAAMRSVDCGGGAAEAWRETVVQVWDVPGGPEARHVTVDKFFGIWRAVDKQLALDPASRLVVEAGDDVGAAVRYAATAVTVEGDTVVVRLGARRATCKPRDRWFAERGQARPVRPLPTAATPTATLSTAGACCTPASGAAGDDAGAPCCS